MIPLGLSFVSVSERAWQRQRVSKLPKFYFDWQQARRAAEDLGTPWTPAVNLFFALDAALELMRAEGLDALFARHTQLAEYVRGGLADLGMRLLADPRYASPTVTTAYVPEGVDAAALLTALEDRHNVVMAGGQGKLEGQIVRVGHMGWVSQPDLAAILRALQDSSIAHGLSAELLVALDSDARPLVLVADPVAEEGLGALRERTRVRNRHGQARGAGRTPAASAGADRSERNARNQRVARQSPLPAGHRPRWCGRRHHRCHRGDRARHRRGQCARRECHCGGRAHVGVDVRPGSTRRASGASLKRGQWSRSAYIGTELTGKTLGLVGLGRVGSEVARRAQGLDMRVVVYDPYVPDEHARRSGGDRSS